MRLRVLAVGKLPRRDSQLHPLDIERAAAAAFTAGA
jgi:hypothetical protein